MLEWSLDSCVRDEISCSMSDCCGYTQHQNWCTHINIWLMIIIIPSGLRRRNDEGTGWAGQCPSQKDGGKHIIILPYKIENCVLFCLHSSSSYPPFLFLSLVFPPTPPSCQQILSPNISKFFISKFSLAPLPPVNHIYLIHNVIKFVALPPSLFAPPSLTKSFRRPSVREYIRLKKNIKTSTERNYHTKIQTNPNDDISNISKA